MAALTFNVRQVTNRPYDLGFFFTNTSGLNPKPTIYVPFDADPSKLGYIAEGNEETMHEGIISFPRDSTHYNTVRRYLLAGKQIIQMKKDEFHIDQSTVDEVKGMLDEERDKYRDLSYNPIAGETDGGDFRLRGKFSSITNGVF